MPASPPIPQPDDTKRGLPSTTRIATLVLVCILVPGLVILTIDLVATLQASPGPKPGSIAKANMKEIENAVELFGMDQGRLPDGLPDLMRRPRWAKDYPDGGYLRTIPKDPWGRAFAYRTLPGGGFEIACLGSDGMPGGTGDAADMIVTDPGP